MMAKLNLFILTILFLSAVNLWSLNIPNDDWWKPIYEVAMKLLQNDKYELIIVVKDRNSGQKVLKRTVLGIR